MRVILQRVSQARVTVAGNIIGSIGPGLVCLAGFCSADTMQSLETMAQKVAHLRIFEDADEKMNLSLLDLGLPILIVSQFTLYADCRKGRRPSFTDAAPQETARKLNEGFVQAMRKLDLQVATGEFQATMSVELVNEGPVTIFMDSRDFEKGADKTSKRLSPENPPLI